MGPYTLKPGEGWKYRYGIDMTVKLGELHPGRGAAFTEYTTRKGEEPPDHTHPTEDEIFYVLSGELTFRCGGGQTMRADARSPETNLDPATWCTQLNWLLLRER